MAMSLTYDPTLSGVDIELTGITPDGFVIVERSANNGPPWQIVRGATNLPVVGGVAQVTDYEFFDAVPNWYRVRRAVGQAGLLLPGNAGDYASTPDDPVLDITGDIDLRVDATVTDWNAATIQSLITKYDTTINQRSYQLQLNFGRLQFTWSTDGAVPNSPIPVPTFQLPGPGERLAVRATLDVDDGAGNHVVRFYTAPTIDGPWTQLGNTITNTGTTSIFAGTADLLVGARDGGVAVPLNGTVHAAEVRDGVNGPEVANPDFGAQTSGTTNFVDDAGRTWTVNGAATIVGEIVEPAQQITPDNGGVTWLKSIKYPALNRPLRGPEYRPIQRAARTGIYNIKGRVPPIAVHDAWTGQYWTIETVTESLAEARDLDLAVIASGTYFLQVPPEDENECFTNPVSGMPGGYVAIINSTQTHAVGGSHTMGWVFFIRIVVPPSPEIYGTTLTWATVERLYGSWTALWASNPTWRDLWDQIGTPEDMVVLS